MAVLARLDLNVIWLIVYTGLQLENDAQWGKITNSRDETSQTRSLPLTVTTIYALVIQATRKSGSDHGYLEFMNGHGIYSFSTTGFTFYDADYGFDKYYICVCKG